MSEATPEVPKDDKGRWSAVIKSIEEGKATPFVGSAVSANNLNKSEPYLKLLRIVRDEINELAKDLKDEDELDDVNAERTKFAGAFRANYLNSRIPPRWDARQLTKIDPAGALDAEILNLFQDKRLRDLRKHLALTIISLTRTYLRLANEKVEYFFSPKPNSVDIRGQGEHKKLLEAVLGHLADVIALLDKKCRSGPSKPLAAILAIFQGMRDKVRVRYDDEGVKKSSTLHPAHIAWMTDLLWLTFRVWLPLYPTSHELAVEMSLISDGRTRSSDVDLLKNAECASDQEVLSKYIEGRFAMFVGRDAVRDSAVLCMHSHYLVAALLLWQATQASSQPSQASNDRRAPIVLTTNYERGLEVALESAILLSEKERRDTKQDGRGAKQSVDGYRVVYPVRVSLSDAGAKLRPRRARGLTTKQPYEEPSSSILVWVCREWSGSSGTMSAPRWISSLTDQEAVRRFLSSQPPEHCVTPEEAFDAPVRSVSASPQPQSFGVVPVVVKLHGSPLDELPLAPSALCSHYLVLSESQYIDAILNMEESMPPPLRNLLLGDTKHLVFVGYSIRDWNVRLQLAKRTVKRAMRSALLPGIAKMASERNLMTRLRIEMVDMDLSDALGELSTYAPQLKAVLPDDLKGRIFD